MADTAFDLFVIGAGSAGVRAARMSAGFGARVAIGEAYRPGGTCVIRGCVPKKLLVYAAHYRDDFEDARAYGWTAQPEFSWPTLIANKNREIAQLEDFYRTLLKTSGVRLLEGRARVLDAHTVEVAGRTYTAAHILVATGGWPTLPAIPGIEHCITSNEALELSDLPRRVLVVGGGYVAAEFTGIFHGVGSKVILAYRGEQILRGFDLDVRQHLHQELLRRGIDVKLGCDVAGIERRPDGALEARLVAAGATATVVVDAVMYATGRHANTAGLGLESAGVKLRPDGAVIVDEYSRSTTENIFAVGDVTQRIALTPVAIREGAAVATTLYGGVATPADHVNVPHAVFSLPPVGVVGLGEAQARDLFANVKIYKTTFRPLKYTLSGRNERTLMKLVVDADSQRVVGAHMVGPDAPEIIQAIAIAVKAGLTKRDFDVTVAVHPTAAEEFVTLR
ncbi:MAG TPA: glutathione-disulfide reductase [Steroidobacteraceae bacterium]|nr:glutathione-disulfide reductase [Steroidobacteraceae bacterium]